MDAPQQDADLYRLLGVEPTASQDEIRSAYRQLALECHPDRNPDDKAAEQKFKNISAAYDILSDPMARAEYDRMYVGSTPTPTFQPRQMDEVVDTVAIIVGSVMGAVRARRDGRQIPRGACPACQGEGELIVDLAIVSFARVCPMCNGSKKAESPSMTPDRTP